MYERERERERERAREREREREEGSGAPRATQRYHARRLARVHLRDSAREIVCREKV